MDFVFLTAHFSNNDAVCNDAVIIAEYLQSQGHKVYYFAPSADANFKKSLLSIENFKQLVADQKTILIYEHCIYMAAYEDLLRGAKCQIWFRYQNITPPHFYEPYDPAATHATRVGLTQTKELVKDTRISFFLPGSEFTANDLIGFGVNRKKIRVIAPISRLDDFKGCSEVPEVVRKLRADPEVNNLLFVGRVVPNKGHRHLIETVNAYLSMYGPKVHLWIVGNTIGQYRKYYQELEQLIEKYQIGDHVSFTGSLTFDALYTFYKHSDVFLLMSEHEGFCVPITEAQYHGLPIVAVDQGPFKDAVGSGQLMTDRYDYPFLAAACKRVKADTNLKEQIVESGKNNVSQFTPTALNQKIQTLVDLVGAI